MIPVPRHHSGSFLTERKLESRDLKQGAEKGRVLSVVLSVEPSRVKSMIVVGSAIKKIS